MEGTSDPGIRKGVGRNGPVRSATPRSRGALPDRTTSADRQRGAGRATTRWCSNGTEGSGRGDTVRLRAGGTLRRVEGVARSGACLTPARGRTTPVARRSVRGSGFRRNAANLMTGCGMQQARGPLRGESRRGGAKPRGRNEAGRVVPSARWCLGATRGAGSGRALAVSVEGRNVTNPKRGRASIIRSGLRFRPALVARGPARVRTLRRRLERSTECRRRAVRRSDATPR